MILIDWFLPGTKAGGPVRSVHALVMHLREHFDFYILTTDTDLGETEPYDNIERKKWVQRDGYEIKYLPAAGLTKQMIQQEMLNERYDKIYLNSLYSKWFSIIPLEIAKKKEITNKIILAPRGMLGSGAMQIKSLKKKLYLSAAKAYGLFRDVTWHATGEHEKKDILEKIRNESTVVVAPNLSWFQVSEKTHVEKQKGRIELFYLSRIAKVKNLHLALEMLKKMPTDIEVNYTIYGPKEDPEYWQKCQKIINALPNNVQVSYGGVIEHENLAEVLCKHHALFLPTSNENFGHSIIESLACGCPVLISDQTPWRELSSKFAGQDLSLKDENGFLKCIVDWANESAAEFAVWQQGARKMASAFYNDPNGKEKYLELFQ